MEVREVADDESGNDARSFRDSLLAYQGLDQVVTDEQDHVAEDGGRASTEGMPEPQIVSQDKLDNYEQDALSFEAAERDNEKKSR